NEVLILKHLLQNTPPHTQEPPFVPASRPLTENLLLRNQQQWRVAAVLRAAKSASSGDRRSAATEYRVDSDGVRVD
ncbi:hypothetical protein Dimus_000737, partial [Dionaea muscipula]